MKQMFHEYSPSLDVEGTVSSSFFVSAGDSQPSFLWKPGTSNLQLSTRVFMDPSTRKHTEHTRRHTEKTHETHRKITKRHGNTRIFLPGRLCMSPFPFFLFLIG